MPAPLNASGGFEAPLALLAGGAWKGSSPVEAAGPGACPKLGPEAPGMLKAGKLGCVAAVPPEAELAPKAFAPEAKGAAAAAEFAAVLAGRPKRPPDGFAGPAALLLPQRGASAGASVDFGPPNRDGSGAVRLELAGGACSRKLPKMGGAQLSGPADASAADEAPAPVMTHHQEFTVHQPLLAACSA